MGLLLAGLATIAAVVAGASLLATGIAAVVIGAGGLVTMEVAERRSGQASPATIAVEADRKPETSSEPKPSSRVLPNGRVVVNVTTDYLRGLFEGRTDVQAQKEVDIWIGKWMPVSGVVDDVQGDESWGFSVTFDDLPFPSKAWMRFNGAWAGRLSVLKPGDAVTVLGKITAVNGAQVTLEECELVDD